MLYIPLLQFLILLIFDAIQAAFVNALIINIPTGEICSTNLIFNINLIE